MPANAYTGALATLRSMLATGEISTGPTFPAETVLAERLDISRGTLRRVLRALNEEGAIPERTRGRRIPSPQGNPLVGDAILVLGTHTDDPGLAESIEGSVEHGCMQALREQGHDILLLNALDGPDVVLARAPGARPRAAVLTQFVALDDRWRRCAERWRAAGIPVVAHGDEGPMAGFDRVVSDHCGGAAELTRQLIATGRRRFLQVWPMANRPKWLAERERGHALALAEAGLSAPPPLVIPPLQARALDPDPANLDTRARAYLGYLFDRLQGDAAPDALVGLNDMTAIPLAVAVRMLGHHVHEQIAIAGFDATWHHAWEWGSTGLAPCLTMHKRNHRVGAAMAEILAERLAGKRGSEPILRIMPTELVRP